MHNLSFVDKIRLVINKFTNIKDKELMHYAASLSFHTIIAVIPVLLISFAIFTKLAIFNDYYQKVKEFIFAAMLPTHQNIISEYMESFLQGSAGLGFIGAVAIIFTSVMFFDDYEYVVNQIMQTKRRRLIKSLGSFLALVIFAPLGLAFSFYISSLVQNLLNSSQYTSWINFLNLFSYLIVWMIFCITYIASLSIKITLKNALTSSLISSIVWFLSKTAFVYYAVYNKTYTSIYGSFSIVLFFLLWIYISWIIFLYGFKICKILEAKEPK